LLAQARGLGLFEIGLMVGAYGLTMLCLEIPTGGLADAIGRKRVAVLSFVFLIAGSVFFIFAFSFIAFVFSWVLTLAAGSRPRC